MNVGPTVEKKSLAYDLVYVPAAQSDAAEYRNAHIDIDVIGNKFKVMIVSETDIDKEDLETLINKIQINVFSKMKSNIADDCMVYLSNGDRVSEIRIAAGEGGLVIKEN